ncbi:MAG: methyl-accepting chemotaxis protein [Pseudomonadota bacterium]|nr:methyl-accepting chemotaxis protein [Pseudomonadota bacterium]
MTAQLTTTTTPITSAAPQGGNADADATLSGDVFGALINLSGRRRFTSQRVVLYAVLASMGHEGAIATARETLALFRDAHSTLIDGKGGLPGVFCGQLRDAYFGTLQGDKVIRNFIKLAESTLDGIVSNVRGTPALLDELVRSATPLLSVLNGLTLVYEEQSKRHAQKQRRQLQEMMGDIKTIARQARMVAFNAQIVAARAGQAGKEFAVVASTMTNVTSEIDELVRAALNSSLGH